MESRLRIASIVFLFVAGLTVVPALGQSDKPTSRSAAKAEPAADPYGMRMWQLVLLRRGPAYGTLQGAPRQKAMQGHFTNMTRLAKLGKLRVSGPFVVGKDAAKDACAGMFLFDVPTAKEARELCATDPSIEAGLFEVEVLTWYGPSDITYRGDTLPESKAMPLFNGKDLSGWHVDVPKADKKPDIDPTFIVRDGVLVSRGRPQGHLITDEEFENYRLVVEYRWPGKPGNCGILVHASKPRRLYGMFPQSIECQMHNGNAGDFWCIGEDISVPDMIKRRGPKDRWGVDEGGSSPDRQLDRWFREAAG